MGTFLSEKKNNISCHFLFIKTHCLLIFERKRKKFICIFFSASQIHANFESVQQLLLHTIKNASQNIFPFLKIENKNENKYLNHKNSHSQRKEIAFIVVF